VAPEAEAEAAAAAGEAAAAAAEGAAGRTQAVAEGPTPAEAATVLEQVARAAPGATPTLEEG
jgi:hypothetical protein